MRVIVLGLAAAICGGEASAQSTFGDAGLAYEGGVVYDDDLVPGRGVNQPYLVEEQSGGQRGAGEARRFDAPLRGDAAERRRVNSRNLIGPDGRVVGY